jgi:hypothetical protein
VAQSPAIGLALAVTALMPSCVQAASSAYRCELVAAVPDEVGAMPQQDRLRTAFGGMGRFTVDRRAGTAIGGLLGPSGAWQTVIMAPGSSQAALKLMLRGDAASPWFLVVDEDQPGPRKPFTLLDDEAVFVGLCE